MSLRNLSGVRVRFAPSPTGSIHLGGLRTALYNYIFAKQNRGQFILRIEDTDQSRVVPGSAEDIEDTLNWAGLRPDESPILGGDYGPYRQSARLALYKQRTQELIESKRAYRCFCSAERLDLLRKYQSRNREKPRYDGKCRDLTQPEIDEKLSENKRHVVRFALTPGTTTFRDLIFGNISNELAESTESDPVILKSDSYPTYHLANVVDDSAMKISHVLRGSEWISSTVKHVQIYQAFNWTPPVFAHFPLITMRDGSKMSKRDNHSHVRSWREAGYKPDALLNFLTNMGGGVPKTKQDSLDLWRLDRLINEFNFDQVIRHPGSVDLDKLRKYNSKDLQMAWKEHPTELLVEFKNLLAKNNTKTDLNDEVLTSILERFIYRIVTLNDLLSKEYTYIWRCPQPTWCKEEYTSKGLDLRSIVDHIIRIIKDSANVEDKSQYDAKLREISEHLEIDWSTLMRLIRKIITNSDTGLPVHEIFEVLGKDRLLEYLDRGLKYVS